MVTFVLVHKGIFEVTMDTFFTFSVSSSSSRNLFMLVLFLLCTVPSVQLCQIHFRGFFVSL